MASLQSASKKLRGPKGSPSHYTRFTQELRDEVVRLRKEEDLSASEISFRLKVSGTYVYIALRDAGVPIDYRKRTKYYKYQTPAWWSVRDNQGYMVWRWRHLDKCGDLAEHRIIMERCLGRALVKGESVHHKNGVRHDNRIENLELWVTPQPSGQRPEDLVVWAKQILERYESDIKSGKL